MEINNLLKENTLLKKNNEELEITLNELIRQDSLIEKWTLMKNFVLVSTEVERLSLAYVQLEKMYNDQQNQQKQNEQLNNYKLEQLLGQNDELNNLVIQLQQNDNKLQQQQIKDANHKISVLIQLNQQLESSEVRLQNEKQKLQQKLFDSNQELTYVMTTLKECENMFKNSLDSQTTMIAKLENQIKGQNIELEKKDKQIENLLKNNKDLIKDIEIIDKKHKEQINNYKNLQHSFEQIQEDYAVYKAQQQSNIPEIINLNKRIEQKSQIITDIENKQDKLLYVVHQLENQIEEKDIRIKAQNQQKLELQGTITEMEQKNNNEINEYKNKTSELRKELQTSLEQLSELKIQNENEFNSKLEGQQIIQAKDQEISKYQQQLQLLRQDQQQMKQVVQDLQLSLNVQNDMFQKSRLEAASLKDSLLTVQEQTQNPIKLLAMEDMCQNLQGELQQMHNQLNYYKHQNYQLIQAMEDLKNTKDYLSNLLMDRKQYNY